MIARGSERRGEAGENAGAVMRDERSLAMHQPAAHDLSAEMLADRLVPQAHAQQRQARIGAGRNQIEADAGLVRCAGAGRKNDSRRVQGKRLVHTEHVIASDLNLAAQFRDDGAVLLGEFCGVRCWRYGRTTTLPDGTSYTTTNERPVRLWN